MQREIIIEQAYENNLKNISLRIPHYNLVVVTGVSGSGKSSLVHDVISCEGQRIFIDHFTGGSFQAAKKMNKPKVAHIEGLLPVVGVNQNSVVRNSRSTVGTLTELYDYLRLLFARLGKSELADVKANRSLFSFNTPAGYCPVCKGLGVEDRIDPALIITDASKSLRDGALILSTTNGYIIYSQVTLAVLDQICREEGFSVDTPWCDLSDEQKNMIWHGSKKIKVLFGKHPLESRLTWTGITAKPRTEDYYRGIITVMDEILRRERNPNIMRFVRSFSCSACHGKRLNKQALSFKLWGQTIDQFANMSIYQFYQWFEKFNIPKKETAIALPVKEAILTRAAVLNNLGLGYLPLHRESTTLSGGEAQRIRLANQVATGLRNVLYLLDEPSAGLHPADHYKLLGVIRQLVDNGNSVIVVEHDEQTIYAADHIIDIGPGPGNKGGEILFNGSAEEFINHEIPGSITSQYLHLPRKIIKHEQESGAEKFFEIRNADKNNLKHIDARFKLAAFNVITGISGSGKSSLTQFLIEKTIPAKTGGTEVFRKVIHIDQSPIGRTPHSNPATYTGLSDHVRDILASLPESKQKGFKKGQFSFVVKGGRCEACGGAGVQQVGMHFLGNVQVECDICSGQRFTNETLSIRYHGKNIFEILEMSIEEAHDFFRDQKKICAFTSILLDLGLGYIKLGQPSTTLSGGEAQRVKLATELSRSATGEVLYILDEPTTGLHPADVAVLIATLRKLADKGHTVLTIEHHSDFILQADWVIDLGPGSGDDGGQVVAEGRPEEILSLKQSLTGQSLNDYLKAPESIKNKNTSHAERLLEPMRLSGVTTNNLKDIDVCIPVDSIISVTGVSGSGKSSLVFDTFYAESQRRFMDGMSSYIRQFIGKTGNPQLISCSGLTPVIGIQKKNVLNNPRSTIATYSGIYDLYRLLFSRLGKNGTDTGNAPSSAFSFNSDEGACSVCKGIGTLTECDAEKLISNPTIALTAGALDGSKTGRFYGDPYGQYVNTLLAVGNIKGIDFDLPYTSLDEEAIKIALYGCGDEVFEVDWKYKRGVHEGVHKLKTDWPGFCGLVNKEYLRKHADHRGEAMLSLMKKETCSGCHGFRLKAESLAYFIHNVHIGELAAFTSDEAIAWLQQNNFSSFKDNLYRQSALSLLQEIMIRMNSLVNAGLGYIALDRPVMSLSGGEFQRLKLAALHRSSITGITYVLDEPSFGLHQKDAVRMLEQIKALHKNGNNVLMVEMSPLFLKGSHYVIEMGPGAGKNGGIIINSGKPEDLLQRIEPTSPLPQKSKRNLQDCLQIIGAKAHNLKNINVCIPSGGLVVITGVSGSGKTSMMHDVVFESYQQRKPVHCNSIKGFEHFDHILYIEQDVPMGTSQSIPATWLGFSDSLKKMFASSDAAKEAEFGESYFSFHSRDGQCPVCKGNGTISVSLDFWSDAKVICENCKGTRFKAEVLDVCLSGINISEVLNMTFSEASVFLAKHLSAKAWKLVEKIFCLADKTGLGYLSIGQSLNTLSTGELQRLKLIQGLSSVNGKNTLIILDEPTGGLHSEDTTTLLKLFNELITNGSSILCVTHDSMVIHYADHLIELGPEGGQKGGYVVPTGLTS